MMVNVIDIKIHNTIAIRANNVVFEYFASATCDILKRNIRISQLK